MRIRVKMIEGHDNLRKGEEVNLPAELADALINDGKAKKMLTIGYEKKVVQPPENKGKEPK